MYYELEIEFHTKNKKKLEPLRREDAKVKEKERQNWCTHTHIERR